MKIKVLGCGASGGVPLIGCDCDVCTSKNLKNKRTRASILVTENNKNILIDTSPDLHAQALAANLKTIDALLFTHAHADHLHGIDDVRAFNHHGNKVIEVYSDANSLQEIQARFDYVFLPPIPEFGWFRPALNANVIPYHQPQDIAGAEITALQQIHGRAGDSTGFRIGNMAYCPDVTEFADAAFALLHNLDVWVVDCLNITPSPTHAHLDLVLSWVDILKPKRTILTHMGHGLDYDKLNTTLPKTVEIAYDGMEVTL